MQLLYFTICNNEFNLPNAITKTEKRDSFFALANYYAVNIVQNLVALVLFLDYYSIFKNRF